MKEKDLIARAARIRLVAFDVDGVLTSGEIIYGNAGEELKAFNTRDGLGIKLLQQNSIEVAIITGRSSEIVARRARELGVDLLIQGRDDKRTALEEVVATRNMSLAECAYMGDDLPDLGAIMAAGVGACPADASPDVMARADWSARLQGGRGAAREFCEFLLRARSDWDAVIWEYGH